MGKDEMGGSFCMKREKTKYIQKWKETTCKT